MYGRGKPGAGHLKLTRRHEPNGTSEGVFKEAREKVYKGAGEVKWLNMK
jgi:hypothetical protein